MFNLDQFSIPPISSDITVASFTEELRGISQSLVQNSLSQYVAYGLKEADALAFLADPTHSVPLLAAEAAIRGVTVEQLAALVKEKGAQMKKIVHSFELIRVEFAARYESAPDKLALRNELLGKAKGLLPE